MRRIDPVKKKVLEKDIQRDICEWLNAQGYFFWRSNNVPSIQRFGDGQMRIRSLPKFTPRGLPDIWVIHQGVAIGIEVKRPGAYMRPEQAKFGELMNKNGGEYHVVRSLDDAKSIFSRKHD